MNIQTQNIIKAGGITGGAGIALGLLATLPFRSMVGVAAGPDPVGLLLGLAGAFPSLGCILVPALGLGFVLLPTAAGLGFGYWSETRRNLAVGGALAGAFGGLVYGIGSGLVSLTTRTGSAAFLQDVDAIARTGSSAIVGVLIGFAIAIGVGLFFGAVGGALSRAVLPRADRSAATGTDV